MSLSWKDFYEYHKLKWPESSDGEEVWKANWDTDGNDDEVSEDEYNTRINRFVIYKSFDFPDNFDDLLKEIAEMQNAADAKAAKAAEAAATAGEQSFGSMFGTFTAITDNLKAIWTEGNNEFFYALAIIILGVIAINLFNQFRVYSNMLTRKEESLFKRLKRSLFD